MADFTTMRMEGNNATTVGPAWQDLSGANHEIRWSDSAAQAGVASAAWPAMIRPAATAGVDYTYAFTADAAGDGFYANGGACPAWARANYLWARWWWDNLGTFASAPIYTAYLTIAHAAIVRGPLVATMNMLQGSADTLNGVDFSYLKGNAFGRVTSAGAPGAAPGADALVTDGTAGSVSPAAGANWLAAFQSLMGDNDWITAPFTPAATTQDQWNIHFRLFTGPNMWPGLYQVVQTLKYTWT
jgi:hypothetical protein